MTPFRLEGSFCFVKIPPGFELEQSLYDIDQDGASNYMLRVVPMTIIPVEEE